MILLAVRRAVVGVAHGHDFKAVDFIVIIQGTLDIRHKLTREYAYGNHAPVPLMVQKNVIFVDRNKQQAGIFGLDFSHQSEN